jgi:hypothetical protein
MSLITKDKGAERRQALGCVRGTLRRASDVGPQAPHSAAKTRVNALSCAAKTRVNALSRKAPRVQ